MNLSGCHFDYASIASRPYGLIFGHVNTSEYVSLAGEISSHTVFNRRGNRRYHVGSSYKDSPIQFTAEIVSEYGEPIPYSTIRAIEKWLFYRENYAKLYIDADDDDGQTSEVIDGALKRLYLNCRFVNPEKLVYGGGVAGWQCTVECDSCMAWQDAVIKTQTLGLANPDSNAVFALNVDTDLNDYLYPSVTITTGDSGGDITISNNSDDSARLTTFKKLTPNTTFVMDGSVNYISGGNYVKFPSQNFIRLVDGANAMTVIGSVESMIFEWQNRRYL